MSSGSITLYPDVRLTTFRCLDSAHKKRTFKSHNFTHRGLTVLTRIVLIIDQFILIMTLSSWLGFKQRPISDTAGADATTYA